MLDVCLLGTGGMMPMPNRFLSSMLLRLRGRMVLVDCGEGTQVSLKLLGWGFKAIDAICFTHYHADHISGLPGMLLTIGNSGRTEPLKLYGPPGLREVVEGLLRIAGGIPFPIEYYELRDTKKTYSIAGLTMNFLPVNHSVPSVAYRFLVERQGKFDAGAATALGLPKNLWSVLQKEGRVTYEGREYLAEQVIGPARPGIRLAYCTDSRPVKALPEFVGSADLFVCEGIYGDDAKRDKAVGYKHMLFSEAAKLASRAGAQRMWLTHYSPSMSDPQEFLHNAKQYFEHTELGHDRITTQLAFPE